MSDHTQVLQAKFNETLSIEASFTKMFWSCYLKGAKLATPENPSVVVDVTVLKLFFANYCVYNTVGLDYAARKTRRFAHLLGAGKAKCFQYQEDGHTIHVFIDNEDDIEEWNGYAFSRHPVFKDRNIMWFSDLEEPITIDSIKKQIIDWTPSQW